MWVCEECGTLHTDLVECCGVEVRPLDEAWGDQGRLFELTGNERAHNVMDHLKGEYEHAAVQVRKIQDKLEDAMERRDASAQLLADFLRLSHETTAEDAPVEPEPEVEQGGMDDA